MFVFFVLALQLILIVLKVAGLSTIGWLATFYPTLGYMVFVVALYVTLFVIGFFVTASAATAAFVAHRKLR
jgi:hypothetical protein